MEFIPGREWSVKRLSSMVPANRLDTMVGRVECVDSQCSFGDRHSMTEEILTGVMLRHGRTPTQAKWEEVKGNYTKYFFHLI